MKILFLLLLSIFVSAEEAPLQQALTQLPNGKLRVEFVLKKAIETSSSFQALKATRFDAEALDAESESPLDWTLFGNYQNLHQKKDTVSPFEPSEVKSDSSGIGLRKSFLSGTSFESRIGNSWNELLFNSSTIQIPSYYEDSLTFSLKQNLWADFFGVASRALYKSQKGAADSVNLQSKLDQQNWAIKIIQLFHDAWLSQKVQAAASESVKRREQLLRVTQSKLNKGTSEKQDLLQVQAAHLNSLNELSRSSANLNEAYRSLVVMLNLPDIWLDIPPEKIPLELSDPLASSLGICKSPKKPEDTFEVLKPRWKKFLPNKI